MKTDPRLRIEICDRDKKLFSGLCQVGCLTPKQIQNRFFRNTNYRNTLKRLEKLTDYGFIRRLYRHDGLGTSIYYPNVFSVKRFVTDIDLEKGRLITRIRPWYFPNIEHDDLVRECALKVIEHFPNYEVLLDFQIVGGLGESHTMFESDKRKVPDIAVKSDSGVSICIEVELSTKSLDRYKSILERFLLLHNFAVIYFYRESRTPTLIQKAMSQMGLTSFPALFFEFKKDQTEFKVEELIPLAIPKAMAWEKTMWGQPMSPHQKRKKLSELLK